MNPDSLQTVIDSLQQIVVSAKDTVYIINSTPTDSTNYLAWFLAFTTLVAVFVAPYFQSKIAKKQIHASTVTANRREWINAFRDTATEYVSFSYEIVSGLKFLGHNSSHIEYLTRNIPKVKLLQNKIVLLLVSEESNSPQIVELMQKAVFNILKAGSEVKLDDKFATAYSKIIEELMQLFQETLKNEWESVINGK